MSDNELRLRRDRALRDRSWTVLRQQLEQIQDDLAARGLGSRAASTAAERARGAADTGVAMARANKSVVAGTIGAMLVWLFRGPILRGLDALTARFRDPNDKSASEHGEPDREQAN